ncbi:uncharacterized protein LOC112690831 [Sipha flava]|uniref:Uncharacterized protein LOC112690831 n=1 Tax=Sipha flava TaxID=143950 RepID=A0A2S2QKD2_9HEMI|nr:uncharacterized protein LOC112690831 [Sipha flava]XP_025420708.1 uncharacterized protein LOC112690831 [Sipha flava]
MWLKLVVVFAAVQLNPAQSNFGQTRTSFSNELRTGFARLFRNGVEQPLQPSPFVLLNPTDFQTVDGPLVQRPAPFSPLAATGYSSSRPRFPFPPRGGRRQNDVLVVVVKTKSNCTTPGKGGGGDGGGDDDDDDDDDDEGQVPLNPDDDVEEVSIVAGGVEKGKEPSRCVWAILSCCAPSNTPIRYTCFDVLGCSTAFWDTNPCVPAILKAALDQATQFYGPTTATNRTETPTTMPPSPPPTSPTPAGSERVAVDLKSFIESTITTTSTAATDTTVADATQAA